MNTTECHIPSGLKRMSKPIAGTIFKEVIHHAPSYFSHTSTGGGITGALIGAMGCGKSTAMYHLCQAMTYSDPKSKRKRRETVLYRGRQLDNWNWIDPFQVYLHVHESDTVNFSLESAPDEQYLLAGLNRSHIRQYSNSYDLLKNIERNRVNVVYEPTRYAGTDELHDFLERVGYNGAIQKISPSVFWIDLIDRTIRSGNHEFWSFFLDEADDIFPGKSAKVRYYLNEWLWQSWKDSRKFNKTMILSSHKPTNIDWRIKDLVNYWIWMKGAIIPSTSAIIHKRISGRLPIGWTIFERGGEFGPIPFPAVFKPQVLVHFNNDNL